MKIGAAFGSYLKQEHIGEKHVLVTIKNVAIENVGDEGKPENKPVVYFERGSMGMVLNKTNADSITEILGTDETDEWAGGRIVLYVDKTVMFGGKRVGGIRVAAPPATHVKHQAAPPPVVEDFQAGDEDVPF